MDENTSGSEQVAPNPIEDRAREQGWVPKEEFLERDNADEAKWVEAGEFIRRGELFSKIDTQNRRIKQLDEALQAIQGHYSKVKETEYNRALIALKAEKKAAYTEGDVDKLMAVDEQIDSLREEIESVPQIPRVEQEPHPEFANWVSQNQWYQSDDGMRAYADRVGIKFRQSGMSNSDVLAAVAKKVREDFPQKFKNPNRERPSEVESKGATGKSGNSARNLEASLSDDERTIMNKLIRNKVLTKEQYLADLADTRK